MNTTELLIANALETAKQLRELQESPVADAIFESIVENENGKEIQFERPISDLAFAAFLKIEALVEALESAQRTIAEQDQRLINYASIATKNAEKLSSVSEEEMRQEFEQWAELEGAHPWGYLKKQRNAGGGYSVQIYSYMWTAWKASRSELGIKCEVKGE